MSIAYDIGFIVKPDLTDLDTFMDSLGFRKTHTFGLALEKAGDTRGNFTRIYQCDDSSTPREIEFFLYEKVGEYRDNFPGNENKITAYGQLKTYATEQTHPDLEERLRIIKEKKVKTQHDYYRHLDPERLKFYETALALKDHYNALVISEQTSEEINPNEPFPNIQ
jgi:hypothetical protein